ncbi:MAG: peptidase M16 [Ignavibacteriae bacterium HGW-Ignavibacteriae-3]|nr:MAG: peptidase M16 [Ignavibacteriae bacterium HGW-Ignavibacteriae-3]
MKNKFLVLMLIMFTASISFAQVDRSKKPEPGPAPEVKISSAESFVLPNGLKVFVVENHKLPSITFSLVVDRDPIVEGKNAGYTSAAGQLLRTGTKNRTKDKLDEEIDLLGANISTFPSSILASGLSKYTDKIMDIVSDIILNPDFKQEELEKIRTQTLSGLAYQKDDPDAISGRVSSAVMYGKQHPYGEMETEETVKSITLEMCKNYISTYFRPNVSYLAIVGDINLAKAKKLIEKYLGKWEKKDVPKNEFQNPKAPIVNKVALVDRASSVQSVIRICYPVDLQIGSEDAMKASVANLILGGSATGRLFMNLREAKAYTYGAYSSLNPNKLVGNFTASTKVRNAVTDSAITEVINEMKKIRNEKVSDTELHNAINLLSGSFVRSLERPETIANFAINIARYNLPKDYYKNYLKNLSAVTVDDVQAIAKKYIKPNNAYVVVVGSSDEISKNISKFSMSGKIDYYDTYGESYDPNIKKVPAGVTAEQVLDKYVEVIGGKENILKVKDRTQKMSGSMQGMSITMTQSLKAPNKMYQLVDFGVGQQTMIFDGEKGRISVMGQEQDMPADQVEQLKLGSLYSMLNYAQNNVKTELAGMETLNGKDAYRIVFTFPSGKKSTSYYDLNSGLMVRTIAEGAGASQTIDFDDYREVQGVKYPFKMSVATPQGTIDLITSSIEVNTNLADSLFEVK